MKISLAQINIQSGDVTGNMEKVKSYIERAADEKSDVVVFPEMTDTGYDMKIILEKASRWDESPVRIICDQAKKNHINVIAGISQRIENDVYNALVVVNREGQIIGSYKKTHLITAEPMLEHLYLKPGNELGIIDIEREKIGLMTCYEIRFPEISRILSLKGCKILIIASAWPLVRLPHWQNLIVARAIENQVFVAACGRIGNDTGVQFAGSSMIVSPYGDILSSASQVHETLVSATVDFAFIDVVRNQIKVHQDRRVDLYQNFLTN